MAVTEKQQRYILIGGAGLILLYLLYRWYSGNQASNQASTTGTATPTSASDYASLAGQEQGDVAALQGAMNTLGGQQQSDVAGLQSALAGVTGQESADVSGLTSTIAGLTGQVQSLADLQSSLGNQVAGIAMGVQSVSPATVATHRGGPFYNYYVKVTGHPPPATVQTSSFLYQAWQSGVRASTLQAKPGAHVTPHPSSKNTSIAHPNATHTQQAGTTHPNVTPPRAAAPPPPASPKPKPPAPKPKAPPPKTKPKASGKRK